MESALTSAEVAGALLAVLVVAFLVATFVRRRAIARGATLVVLGGWRRNRHHRWRLGHLRLGPTRLEWFTLLGASLRPQEGWDRSRLELEAPSVRRRSDRLDLLPDAAPVACAYGTERFELALTPDTYTAVRSWAEAAPPGSTANVT